MHPGHPQHPDNHPMHTPLIHLPHLGPAHPHDPIAQFLAHALAQSSPMPMGPAMMGPNGQWVPAPMGGNGGQMVDPNGYNTTSPNPGDPYAGNNSIAQPGGGGFMDLLRSAMGG
jgi:hypothetical protein